MSVHQIDRAEPAVKSDLQELGDALDRAEATIPALRPRRPGEAFAARPPAPFECLSGSFVWIPPNHAAVRAYWRALRSGIRSDHPYVDDDLRMCRRKFRLAWKTFDQMTIERDSGYFEGDLPSLRAILDARAVLVESHMILEQVEGRAKYWRQIKANKRAAERNAKLRRSNPQAHAQRRAKGRRR